MDVRHRSASTLLAKLQLKVRDKLGSVEFLDIDRQGLMFVLAENIPAIIMEGASTFVARFSPSGALEGIYELPLTPSVALSRRFVTVSPDGDVYFLRTRKGVVDVIGVGFRHMKNAKVVDVRGSAPDFADLAKDRKGAIAAVRALTRARVLETARGFEAITWRLNERSYGPEPKGWYATAASDGGHERPAVVVVEIQPVPPCRSAVSRRQRGSNRQTGGTWGRNAVFSGGVALLYRRCQRSARPVSAIDARQICSLIARLHSLI